MKRSTYASFKILIILPALLVLFGVGFVYRDDGRRADEASIEAAPNHRSEPWCSTTTYAPSSVLNKPAKAPNKVRLA